MRHKYDILWKGVLEEVADDLLRFIFPEAEQVFDMKRRFEFLDKELAELYPEPDRGGDTRFVDKLVKVYRADGQEEWVLAHIEIQGEANKRVDFGERMFRYFYRIFDRYRKPVTGIAIFTGPDGKRMPDVFSYEFMHTHLSYRYNKLCILDYENEVLEKSDNPFALVMLAAKTALLEGKIPEVELKDRKLLIAKLLYRKGLFSKKKIEAILTFLNNMVILEDPETNRIFTEEIDLLTGKKNSMNIFEQLAEIKAQEAQERVEEKSVRAFLMNTDFSIEKIANILDIPVSFAERVKEGLSPSN